jgi:hypothetical protein
MYFAIDYLRGGIPKNGLQLPRSFEGRIFNGNIEFARTRRVVVNHQELVFIWRRLAEESVVGGVHPMFHCFPVRRAE